MSAATILDVLTAACLLTGAGLSLTGTIGLLRFPNILARMHATTKPQVLGLVLILAAVGIRNPTWGTISTLLLIALFQLMTAPISAHMIGRAGYRTKRMGREHFVRDELADAVSRATRSNEDGSVG